MDFAIDLGAFAALARGFLACIFASFVSFLNQCSESSGVRWIKRGVQIFNKRASRKYKMYDAILQAFVHAEHSLEVRVEDLI